MSSTEQAPEPTMDEILASIRRIIADDEASGGAHPTPRPAAAREPEPSREEVGARLVDDLAHALRDSDDERPAAKLEEDILDLTHDMFAAEEPEPAPLARPKPSLLEPQRNERPRLDIPWEDRALPTAFPGRSDERPAQEPRAMAMARIAEATPVKATGGHGEVERSFMGGYAEESFAVSEDPFDADDVGEAEPPVHESFKPVAESFQDSFAESVAPQGGSVRWEEEPQNGSVPPAGAKSLEDCVREMLRPMLREWLEANLPRILESAVREEVAEQARDKRRPH